MALPNVTINIENGNLGRTLSLNDGVTGIIATAVAASSKITLGTAYAVTSLKNAEETLGINATGNNAFLYSLIADYYQTLAGSTTLYVLPLADSVTMEAMLTETNGHISKLQEKAKGSIRIVGVSRKASGTQTTKDGLDPDVDKALIKGQATAEAFRKKMQPFRFVVDAKSYNSNSADLKDYNAATYNAGSIFICNKTGNKNNRIGLALGSLSALGVQRKISRVKNGHVPITETPYIGTRTVDASTEEYSILHDKGYVFLRTFQGKSGYFFSSDRTATSTADDYASLSNGRVIDKALIIAYKTYINELNEEIQLTDEGKIPTPVIKGYEGMIENAITREMSEAISDVVVEIDPEQNIISTSKLVVSLRIVPVGYLSEIVVNLGFDNPNTNIK